MTLHNRIALVTGAMSGIGQAVADRLAGDGARVVAADIAAPRGPLATDAVAPAHVDVADAASVAALMAQVAATHGRLDVLVNCAGIGRNVPFLETTPELFDQVLAINLRGTFLVGQAAARLMVRGGGGCIVNIGSISGVRGNAGRTAYGASKGGVTIMSQVMATELAAHNVRVNVVAPGPIETPLVMDMQPLAARGPLLATIPQRRFGTTAEVAAMVAFLVSDQASYVTGAVMAVDGGFLGSGFQPG